MKTSLKAEAQPAVKSRNCAKSEALAGNVATIGVTRNLFSLAIAFQEGRAGDKGGGCSLPYF